MATEKRLIDANEWDSFFAEHIYNRCFRNEYEQGYTDALDRVDDWMDEHPTVDAVEVVHGQRLYNAHEVAVIIANLFGDDCACSFNNIDEWLPLECELQDACPNPPGVACWEQYLKFRDAKMDGGKDNG